MTRPTVGYQQAPPTQIGPTSVGWGILGTGERSAHIVNQAIRQQPAVAPGVAGAWVVGVYSHNEHRAHTFAHHHYLPHSFSNLADLLQRREIQCVYIATHPRHHFPLTMAALAAGKHVLCEMPMALTIDDAETMQLAAENRGLLLYVGHQLRVDPAIRQLRMLLADDVIGDVLGGRLGNTTPLSSQQQSWRLQENVGGVLLNRTTHAIDLLRYLLQDEVAAIYSTSTQQMLGERSAQTVDEDVQSLVTLRKSKLTIQLHDSFFIPHLPTVLELYGSRGTLQVQHWASPTRESRLCLIRSHTLQQLDVTPESTDRQMIFAFTEAVRAGERGTSTTQRALLASADAGRKSLEAVLAARQSLLSNCAVQI